MSYKGTVKNGVVVLEPPARLPEGTAVRVEPENVSGERPGDESEIEQDPLIQMLDLAGPTGIPDLSVNADHYLYGHPKVTNGR